MKNKKLIHNIIIGVSSFFLCLSLVFFLYGLIVPNDGDPYIGTYDVYEIGSGWTLTIDGEEGSSLVDLPVTRNELVGKTIRLSKTLPDNVDNGMTLCVRSSMNDLYIYVDGRIRSVYSTGNYYNMAYHLPSAYVFCDLSKEDAGKEVSIKLFMKSTGGMNSVSYGYPGNIFYDIHEYNSVIVFIGYILIAIGMITVLIYIILSRRGDIPSYLLYIGELTVALGLWLLSENHLRQWIFASQAPTRFYAYMTIEVLGIFACLYFDSVQEKRYHRLYRACEVISLFILAVNTVLAVTGVCDFYRTLIISHLFTGISIIVTARNTILDIIRHRTRRYRTILIGVALFLLSSVIELISFYVNRFAVLGMYLAIGMIILLFCTILQIVVNEIRKGSERLKDQERFALRTLEAFAGSIDARDEYTGGHSYRVAEYASKLARAVASTFHFTDEDIKEIHYIGLMHDIGKIALPDSILNSSGKLTEEEFSLVKQHVVIGEQLLISLKHSQNLLDGVRSHHERYDGTGYPDGLSGSEIPIIARILAIADSYDAMTSSRVFREPMTGTMAKAEIIACSGSQFDPHLAEVFCSLIDRRIIFPIGYEGIEHDDKDNPLQSALLQLLLRRDTLSADNSTITRPSHIRTACFIARVAEKNNSKVDIYMVGLDRADRELMRLKDFYCRSASLHDLILEYSADKLVLIFIDRKDSDIADLMSRASAIVSPDTISIRKLSPALLEEL
ncbi:MAG: HD domain-containing protein [Lachnospiraceae bacterium]|nr:HD domain-containing protein [Lachnospiraceae bacterium]